MNRSGPHRDSSQLVEKQAGLVEKQGGSVKKGWIFFHNIHWICAITDAQNTVCFTLIPFSPPLDSTSQQFESSVLWSEGILVYSINLHVGGRIYEKCHVAVAVCELATHSGAIFVEAAICIAPVRDGKEARVIKQGVPDVRPACLERSISKGMGLESHNQPGDRAISEIRNSTPHLVPYMYTFLKKSTWKRGFHTLHTINNK